jgi:hypothetical protein
MRANAMMSRTLLLGAMLALAGGSSARAECVEAIAMLEERIVAADGEQAIVELRASGRRVVVEQAPGGVLPNESWGGASSATGEARDKLRDARLMAEDGDEDGCLVLVEEARLIIDGLVR